MASSKQESTAQKAEVAQASALRIVHIGKFYPPDRGGMETYLADLMQQQRANGMDARALVHGQPQADDPAWIERLAVQVRLIFTPIALGFPWAIRRQLKTFRPDVLHLHMPNVAVFWLLFSSRARRVPWVVHWHSDVTFNADQWALALAYRIYRPFERAVLAQTRFIIATSPPYLQASKTLADWQHKCVAIPLGLQQQFQVGMGDPEAAMPSAESISELIAAQVAEPAKQQYESESSGVQTDWSAGKLRILSIGRLTYYKGFDTLIRAVAALPDAQLRIVGDGDLRLDLNALVADLRLQGLPADIQILGSVSEAHKHRLLASCDVFALASRERTEAFGLALVEAMQFGKPCVVSDLAGSGMPWLIRQSGAGLCVAMDDLDAWRSALTQLAGDQPLRQQFGAAGRLAAQQYFSIGANSRHVKDLYASLLPERKTIVRAIALVLAINQPVALEDLQGIWAHCQTRLQGALVLVCSVTRTDAFYAVLAQWARAHRVALINTAFCTTPFTAMQTAMRWALRQGFDKLLFVPAPLLHEMHDQAVLLAAIDEVLAPHQPSGADIVQATAVHEGVPLQRSWGERWFAALTGADVSLDHAHSLYLFNHAALQQTYQKRVSLLDQPEMGLVLLLRQTQMQVQLVPNRQLAKMRTGHVRLRYWHSLRLAVAGTLMFLAKKTWGQQGR